VITNAVITAYCACRICCGAYSTAGLTASGTKPREHHTIAAPSWVPFGAVVVIGGRRYVVEDRASKRYPNRFDIYMHSHKAAKQWGIQQLQIDVRTK